MRLVLVRHGEAESSRGNDAGRVLTVRGREQAGLTGKWLVAELAGHGQICLVASPYRRAQETAAVLAQLLQVACETVAGITPDEDARRALVAIENAAGDADVVVVVTHMPLVAALASWLESGSLSAGQGFMLAEARVYEAAITGPAMARLAAHFIPGITN